MLGKKSSIVYLIFAFSLVMTASYFSNRLKEKIVSSENQDDYEIVKKYLLNDSLLYGKNRPKIWIHSTYEINARKWKNFMSRNSTDLNQPYLYLTVQSIINHCGDDFHICLIDDDSFSKLIPSWSIDMATVPEPMRSRWRNIGMAQLIYIYGGVVVPNSFLCTKPLINMYHNGKTPFILEKKMYGDVKPFMPDIQFMGATKEDPVIKDLIQHLNLTVGKHFQQEHEFLRTTEKWCAEKVLDGKLNLIDGKFIGVKDKIGKPILIEDLMNEYYLNVDEKTLIGIFIPKNELLRRPKYQYFTILPWELILESNIILSKYFKSSIVDGTKSPENKFSVVAI